MKSKEIFERIENIINSKINSLAETTSEDNSDRNIIKEITYLILQFFLNIFKAPFQITAKYLRDEIIKTVKKDAKIYMMIMGIMGILFVFFSVMWLFISVAIGVYFFEQGNSILISIIFSIGFQIICFILISLIAFFASKRLKSLNLLKELKNFNKK